MAGILNPGCATDQRLLRCLSKLEDPRRIRSGRFQYILPLLLLLAQTWVQATSDRWTSCGRFAIDKEPLPVGVRKLRPVRISGLYLLKGQCLWGVNSLNSGGFCVSRFAVGTLDSPRPAPPQMCENSVRYQIAYVIQL